MNLLYPLRFRPIFQRYIWGGRRLNTLLGKPTGEADCAESWEIVDHDQAESVVAEGFLKDSTLKSLLQRFGPDILGEPVYANINSPSVPDYLRMRFPLLFKFLDANQSLSVQVHPDDEIGSRLTPPDLGKTEAWYVMHADEGAKIFAGLKPEVSRDDFAQAVSANRTEDVLNSFDAHTGQCVFIRAGTVHAIGSGLLIAEIQQASNTTFRVFDWNRIDAEGNSRPLHIEQALESIDFELGPVAPTAPNEDTSNTTTLVKCDKFIMKRHRMSEDFELGNQQSFRILAVTQGAVEIDGDPTDTSLCIGGTVLLPAVLGSVKIRVIKPCELLEIFVPTD